MTQQIEKQARREAFIRSLISNSDIQVVNGVPTLSLEASNRVVGSFGEVLPNGEPFVLQSAISYIDEHFEREPVVVVKETLLDRVNGLSKNYDTLLSKYRSIGELLYEEYSAGTDFGKLKSTLAASDLAEDELELVLGKFYPLLAKNVVSRYAKTTSELDEIATDFVANYGELDMGMLLTYVSKSDTLPFDIEELTYKVYKKDEEVSVIGLLTEANRKGWDSTQIKVELDELNIGYPNHCVIKTLEEQESKGFVLPYTGLYVKLGKIRLLGRDEENDSIVNYIFADEKNGDHSDELELGTGIVSIKEKIKAPTPADMIVTTFAEPEQDKRRRMKIVDRVKETKKIERGKTIACALTGVGALATTVLTVRFDINPMTAAQNCWDAIQSISSGTIGLNQFLQQSWQAIASFSAVATTISGLIKFNRFSSKAKKGSFFDEEPVEAEVVHADVIIDVDGEEFDPIDEIESIEAFPLLQDDNNVRRL